MRILTALAACVVVGLVVACGGKLPVGNGGNPQAADAPKPDMTVAAFELQRPQEAKIVRCKCALTKDYYDSFTRCDGSHYAVKTLSLSGESFCFLTVYVEKNTPVGKRIYEKLKDAEGHVMTVKISTAGRDGVHDDRKGVSTGTLLEILSED